MPRIRGESIEAHKEITRCAIMDAAAEAFLTFGLAGASIGAIADLAGIARTTIYEYYPNKETLLLAVLEDRVPPLVDDLVDSLPDVSLFERMEKLVEGTFRLAVEHPDLVALLFRVGRELPKPERDEMWYTLDRLTDELYRLCSMGIATGEFAAGPAGSCGRMVADLLVGGVDELTHHEDLAHAEPSIRAARLAFLRHGLGVDRPASGKRQ